MTKRPSRKRPISVFRLTWSGFCASFIRSFSGSRYRPADREECLCPGPVCQLALQRVDELVALLDDLVLAFEDLLALPALLALKLLDLLLNLTLLGESNRLPSLTP